jgi:hypothetical protein
MRTEQAIKVMKGTPDRPEMAEMGRHCGTSQSETFLAFFELSCHFDTVGKDGFIPSFRKVDADKITGIDGFGAALEFVGWVTFRDEGAKLNEWKKHGENTPKQRVLKARKKQPLSGKK